jgi:nicotinamidase/pyrazinamidase
MRTENRTALIAVDVQNDFLPGGALAVPAGDEVVAPLVAAAADADIVVASQDWHPADHCSFSGPNAWPVHCVQGTRGAELHPEVEGIAHAIVMKADDPAEDAYSAFQGTDLAAWLRDNGVTSVVVGGLALDYCVKATALDAQAAGFRTTVLLDATRAVNLSEGDAAAAVEEMQGEGVEVR